MDVLSEVLKAVKLGGALFYNAEYFALWCFRAPASRTVAPYLSSDPRHVILFKLLTEGRGYAHVEGNDRQLPLSAGTVSAFRRAIHTSWETVCPSHRWTTRKRRNKPYLRASRSPARAEVERSANSLRLHGLRSTTQPGLPWRAAAHHKSQHPRRLLGPMAGKFHPPFGG